VEGVVTSNDEKAVNPGFAGSFEIERTEVTIG